MMRNELQDRVESQLEDWQWQMAHEVYQNHPTIKDVGGKDQIAEIINQGWGWNSPIQTMYKEVNGPVIIKYTGEDLYSTWEVTHTGYCINDKPKTISKVGKAVKERYEKEYPHCNWSTRIERFSMGQSLTVRLVSAPFDAFAGDIDSNGNVIKGYAQLNQYQFLRPDDSNVNNGTPLTKQAWECMTRAYRIANKDNWDNSDPQTDYFDVNYWLHLEIGQWDKPFIKTA